MIRVTVRNRPDRKHLQLAYTDPLTGKIRTRSAKTSDPKQAERAAATWEAELAARVVGSRCSWDAFRTRFHDEYQLDNANTMREYSGTLSKFEQLIGSVRDINLIDSSVCSRFQAEMRKTGLSVATISKHLRQLGVILNWAADIGMLARSPKIRKPKQPKRNLRGRPLTIMEFARLLSTANRSLDDEYRAGWVEFMKGMWLTGMRLSEAWQLSWDSGPVRIDLTAEYPRIVFRSDGQKNSTDELVPLAPDAVRFFRRFTDRTGPVFRLHTPHRNGRVSLRVAGHVVSELGELSGIESGESESGKIKFASSHDLRRTFGNRWAMRIHPIVLKTMMRHANLNTTMKYYVAVDCDSVAKQVVQAYTHGRQHLRTGDAS